METWWATLESTGLAEALSRSVWVYPLVNAGHILGVALLVGAIVPLDLRLLGLWRSVPLAPLWQVLSGAAAFGLSLAILFGFLLFITRATEYTDSRLFVAKMLVVGVGIANAMVLNRVVRKTGMPGVANTGRLPVRYQLAGVLSLMAWLTALTLGRLVGYF